MATPNTYDNPAYFINREISWLSFNERVLEEALDEDNPLFERLRFLAITSSNLDEFFMVRVAGLKDQVNTQSKIIDDKTQMTAAEQWLNMLDQSRSFMNQQSHTWNHVLRPLLNKEGFSIVRPRNLTRSQKQHLAELFMEMIYPVLTPMAVDASRPFPMLYNGTLNLAVLIEAKDEEKEEYLFAFVQVPSVLPRLIEIETIDGQKSYILLEDVIRMHLSELFRGRRILAASCFRITRDADLVLNEDAAEDLLEEIERELTNRKSGDVVRIEVERGIHPYLVEVLKKWEEVSPDEVFELDGPLDLTFLFRFVNNEAVEGYRFPPFSPIQSPELGEDQEIFEVVREKDVLLYHPYESFEPVVRLIQQAAQDPRVLAMKMTLYRVGGDSPIIAALAEAAEHGKQVTVLLELRARFDEEKNIVWAKKLEKAGCHVIYGLVGLKTHAKMALIVRREQDGIRRYVHLGTGNYNENTARLYTDFSLFTSNEGIGEDITSIFNQLSGYSTLPKLNFLRVAPWNLESALLAELEEVAKRSTKENPGRIIAKMNSLTDKHMIQALYRTSQAGVKIDLIVRGICCLRPGIKGVSDNIRVHSIVGRFLEHGRAYYFRSPGRRKVFLSSADWMTRNLEMRVETMFPVLAPKLKKRVIDILETQLADNVKRRELQSNGVYKRAIPDEADERIDSQERLYKRTTRLMPNRRLKLVHPSEPGSI